MAAQTYRDSVLRKSSASNSYAVIAVIALMFSVLLALGCLMLAAPWAYGENIPDGQSTGVQTYETTDNTEQIAQSSEEAIEGEQISDDAVPMASGLESSEIMSANSIGFQWAIIAGIAAVVAFFALSMRKTNSSITKMRNMMR